MEEVKEKEQHFFGALKGQNKYNNNDNNGVAAFSTTNLKLVFFLLTTNYDPSSKY